jgi:D-aspartate ligase
MTNDLPVAVLCGDLNMLRCFAGHSMATVVVRHDRHDLTRHSRYCRDWRLIPSPLDDPDATLHGLLELGRSFQKKPILFYGDDAMLLLISRHREQLNQVFRFLVPPMDLLDTLVDKTRFAALAAELELPVPKSIRSRDLADGAALESFPLPCVIKPANHLGWFKSSVIQEQGGLPRKVLYADNRADLRRLCDKMRQFTDDFLLQQYIPGGPECIYSFHAYLDRNGHVLASYAGRKIRTYPRESGLSTYLELIHDPRLAQTGLEILRKLQFVGVVKLDFKKDPGSDQFFLLEANPRFTLWNFLAAAAGVNLPLVAYNDLAGFLQPVQSSYRDGLRWLSLGDDFRTLVLDYMPAGQLSFFRWLTSLAKPKVHDVFAWTDPGPALVDSARSVRHRLGLLVRQGRLIPKPPPSRSSPAPVPPRSFAK